MILLPLLVAALSSTHASSLALTPLPVPRATDISTTRRSALSSILHRPAAAAAAAAALATTAATAPPPPVHAAEPPPPLSTVYSTASPLAPIDYPDPQYITTVLLDSSTVRAGVELVDTKIGSPNPRKVAAVKSLLADGEAARQGVLPGMVLLKYPDSSSVRGRLKGGPYPIVLQFYNLAGGGGGGEGTDGLSPQDALLIAEERAKEQPRTLDVYGNRLGGLDVKVVRKVEGGCGEPGVGEAPPSKRGDDMEIKYEARIGGRDGIVYDSSDESGLGRYKLGGRGSDQVVQGVDLGTFDMCVGEVRELDVPSSLGYGGRGNQFYLIPPGSRLWWRVELVGKRSGDR